MNKSKYEVSEFNLTGQLVDFVIKDGYKIKYLRMSVSDREYWIKLKKEIRHTLDSSIAPGCWLSISGRRELSLKNGKVKLKADRIELRGISSERACPVQKLEESKPKQSKACVLVCRKSDCWNRGAREIFQVLEEGLKDLGLEERVAIKPTGCLKQCKYGPNLVVMPDKTHYTRVHSTQIHSLIEKHFNPSDSNSTF